MIKHKVSNLNLVKLCKNKIQLRFSSHIYTINFLFYKDLSLSFKNYDKNNKKNLL